MHTRLILKHITRSTQVHSISFYLHLLVSTDFINRIKTSSIHVFNKANRLYQQHSHLFTYWLRTKSCSFLKNYILKGQFIYPAISKCTFPLLARFHKNRPKMELFNRHKSIYKILLSCLRHAKTSIRPPFIAGTLCYLADKISRLLICFIFNTFLKHLVKYEL